MTSWKCIMLWYENITQNMKRPFVENETLSCFHGEPILIKFQSPAGTFKTIRELANFYCHK